MRSFLVREPDETGFIGPCPAPAAGIGTAGPGGTTLRFAREKVHDAGMTGTFTVNRCRCVAARPDGRPAGVSAGYVIRAPRRRMSDAEFFDRCDAESQELASLADALINQHGPVRQLFDVGPVFYLRRLEVASDLRGQGLGIAILERHLERLRSAFRGMATVVVRYAPAQFDDPFDGEAPDEICDEHARAVAKLMTHWERHQPHRVLGIHARLIAFDVARTPGHREQLLTLIRHTGLN